MNIIRHSRDRRRGQGLVEYGVVVALIAVLAIGSLGILGAATTNVFSNITAGLNNAVGMDNTTADPTPTDTPMSTLDPSVCPPLTNCDNPTPTADPTDTPTLGPTSSFCPPLTNCDSLSASPVVTSVWAMGDFLGMSTLGFNVSFIANASGGSGELSYQWSFPGTGTQITTASGSVFLPGPGCPGGNWTLNISSDSGSRASYFGPVPDEPALCPPNNQ